MGRAQEPDRPPSRLDPVECEPGRWVPQEAAEPRAVEIGGCGRAETTTPGAGKSLPSAIAWIA